MAILESQLAGETDKSLTLNLTGRGKTYTLTVAKIDGYTNDELIANWTRRATREFMSNPGPSFQRMFIDRVNRRHERIIAGEIAPVTGE